MKVGFFRLFTLTSMLIMGSIAANGQVATSSLSGSVLDPSGAVVANATINVKNNATGVEFKSTTASNGTFSVPQLAVGIYTVSLSATGFKQALVQDVKIDAGVPASLNVTLEVGQQSESVVVQGGADVLQTQSANISTTITGRQIIDLPFTSRDALDLVLLLPGTSTPGRPRTSTVNGLPKGALNISMDGVNVQDNVLKSSDGFFTYIRPRIDAIDEVTLSTATPGAESAGEGAVQIKFVTRSGSNEFHGSVYEYHRNPALNANYWFSNRDLRPNPGYTTAPRDRILLNQFGARVGGPIIKDRAFFFTNYEEYRLPEQVSRARTILSPSAQSGIYTYSAGGVTRQINMLTLASSLGQTSTVDPTVGPLLAQIRSASSSEGNISALTDPNLQRVDFTNTGGQKRYFPTVRLDFNLTDKHHLENVWNYQKFGSVVDFLNSVDPAFPGFPNHGSQISNRFSNVTALRSTFTSALVNEVRVGFTGGSLLFFPEVSPADFANQGGYSLGINAAGITSATATRAPSRRNSPVFQLGDTVSYTRAAHSMTFGFNWSRISYWGSNPVDGVVRALTMSMATADPAQVMFTAANFPNASTTQLAAARNIYAVLTGRITGVTGQLALDETTSKYSLNGEIVQRARQNELGFFAQDSWRVRPNLTLTGGLRWEIQMPFKAMNDNFSQTPYAELFGVSGADNMFKPGTLTGKVTQFYPFTQDDKAYNTYYGGLAPSVGFAWTPDFKGGLGKIFGENGQTVLRGGYSIAYNREGMNVVLSILGANPGGTQTAAQSVALGNLPATGILLRNGIPSPTGLPAAPVYPLTAVSANSANAFLPDLKTGYVQSWTFGLQRELGRDTAIEFRYVGNRGVALWRQHALNEYNVIENGFINEFKLAQANLAANTAAGGTRAGSFAYFGPGTGTSPLPITVGHFNGVNAANAGNAALYTSTFFRNSTFINNLNPALPSAIGFATNLQTGNVLTFLPNAAAAGLPRNLFIVNPDVQSGGSFLVDNGGRTSYDALVIELRRRLSKGLLVQGSYTWGSAFTNMYASSSSVFSDYFSHRYPDLNKSRSPFVITHAVKANWIYELPIGQGKALLDEGGWVNAVAGGWAWHGTARIQSGSPFNFGRALLVGMTAKELQDMIKVRKEAAQVFFLPDDVILNSQRAFGNASGTPTGRYIAPVNSIGPESYVGQNGFTVINAYGPKFTRFDLSLVKTTKITERVNFEFRAEFLNAFNNINFLVGNPANDVNTAGTLGSLTFGQVTQAYRDTSTTNDPGGRMIQFVLRVNF